MADERDRSHAGERRMRVLLSLRPYLGHLHPFVPLALRLQRAGHEVAAATARDVASTLQALGVRWYAAGLHPREAGRRFPDDDADYGYPTLQTKVDDLLELARTTYRPDVIVRDPTDLAAAVAAEVAGIPCVTLGVSNLIPVSSWLYLARDSLARLRRAYGLPDDPDLGFLYRTLYADLVPPVLEWFDEPPFPTVRAFRYEAWDGGDRAARPRWLDTLPSQPTVLVTLGTVYNHRPRLFATLLDALASEDMNVICTLGDGQAGESLGSVPASVRIERYLPQSLVLPACDVVLCHGGFNTMMGAVCAGVPLVCIPLGSDQFYNARRCAEIGIGIRLEEADVTESTIRQATWEVIRDPGFRDRALDVRRELDGLPDHRSLVGCLEDLSVAATAGSARGVPGCVPGQP